jgi:hypothetical protein
VRREASPPAHRRPPVALPLGRFRETLHRTGELAGQPAPLAVDPALQLRSLGDEEAIQEGAGIERNRPGVVAPGEGVLELAHVGRELGREPEPVAGRDDGLAAERLVDPVDRVGEQMAGPLGVRLGPQIGEQLVAAHAPLARHGEQGGERQAPALDRASGQRTLGRHQRRPAEELETEHVE